jgi:hypothetical protein
MGSSARTRHMPPYRPDAKHSKNAMARSPSYPTFGPGWRHRLTRAKGKRDRADDDRPLHVRYAVLRRSAPAMYVATSKKAEAAMRPFAWVKPIPG